MKEGVGRMYEEGAEVRLEEVNGEEGKYERLPNSVWQRQRYWFGESVATDEPVVLTDKDLKRNSELEQAVEKILHCSVIDGTHAMNRSFIAPYIFLSSNRKALFYFNQKKLSVTALIYVGGDQDFIPLVEELLDYATSKGLQLNIIAKDDKVSAIANLGFSTTPCGVHQSIKDLKSFTLSGNRMRRLRYLVKRYEGLGECATIEHNVGNIAKIDKAVAAIIEDWQLLKGKTPPFAARLKEQIINATLDSKYRVFITRRNATIDNVIILSPTADRSGWLLDSEFYGANNPLGSLEFAVVKIIEKLSDEGATLLSLGGAFGTQLAPHPNADREVERSFALLHANGLLNGDGNRQFKNKFRPLSATLYLCRPRAGKPFNFEDVISALSGQSSEALLNDEAASERMPTDRAVAKTASVFKRQKPVEPTRREPFCEQAHPLLGRRLHLAGSDLHFESQISLHAPSYLSDHLVSGKAVMPGAAYLEMALAAAKEFFIGGFHCVSDVAVRQPMLLREGESRTVQLILQPENSQVASFAIYSSGNKEAADGWILHASGTVHNGVRPFQLESAITELEDFQKRAGNKISGQSYYRWLAARGLEFGPNFQGIQQIWQNADEAWGLVRLPDSLDSEAYRFHPVLLDSCLQMLAALLPDDGKAEDENFIYLLMGVENLELYERIGVSVWCRVTPQLISGSDNSIFAGNARVFDEAGRIVAKLEGVRMKRANRDVLRNAMPERLNDCVYEVQWFPRANNDSWNRETREQRRTNLTRENRDTWLLFADSSGVADKLAKRLSLLGLRSVLVYRDQNYQSLSANSFGINPDSIDDFKHLFAELAQAFGDQLCGVAHLWSLDVSGQEQIRIESLKADFGIVCQSALYLLQSLIGAEFKAIPRLWLITRGAQCVGFEATGLNVSQASLWGLGRVVCMEHPEIFGGLIDLEPLANEEDVTAILEQIGDENREDQIAYRNGQAYAPRLVRVNERRMRRENIRLNPDATYLITGGMGGLGLVFARWMIERGAKHVALGGRGAASDEVQEIVSQLTRSGARVEMMRADVANQADVKRIVGEISSSMPPLRGVIHAAGVLEDRALINQDWDGFAKVLAPKALGAWNLHYATQREPIDFFVLLSSASSVLGPPGQSNHAAANAFLDALAHHRQQMGLPALSIDWGPWSDVGAATKRRISDRAAMLGVKGMSAEQSIAIFDRTLNENFAQIAVMSVDWRRWREQAGNFVVPTLLSSLIREEINPQPDAFPSKQSGDELAGGILAAEPERRKQMLEAYVCKQTAKVLRLPESRMNSHQSLDSLGLDSLMRLELKKKIEGDLKVKLPMVIFLQDITVAQLVADVSSRLPEKESRDSSNEAGILLKKLDQISDSEVDSLLRKAISKQRSGG